MTCGKKPICQAALQPHACMDPLRRGLVRSLTLIDPGGPLKAPGALSGIANPTMAKLRQQAVALSTREISMTVSDYPWTP
jgi:hypothetical protein